MHQLFLIKKKIRNRNVFIYRQNSSQNRLKTNNTENLNCLNEYINGLTSSKNTWNTLNSREHWTLFLHFIVEVFFILKFLRLVVISLFNLI